MALDVKTEMSGTIAIITLNGELDAASAHAFRAAIDEVTGARAQRLVLMMNELEYMASAGLRVLIYAKQKLGSSVDIYVVGAPEMIRETIEMTGFHHSVTLRDEYDPAEIEDL